MSAALHPGNAKYPRASTGFQSLVERSITAWHSLTYVGTDRDFSIDFATRRLRGSSSLESVLERREYWFFQRRESFMRQPVFMKWDPHRLEEYVLLPINYGFANKRDCFFVSHYWRTKGHPDPEAIDLRLICQDLKQSEWSYIWVDWTCMPQVPRSEVQTWYFQKMLRCIPMLIRDCAFEWRFPIFEPRAWILYEIAENLFNHKDYSRTDDNRQFISHVFEMHEGGVKPVLDKYGYKCTNQSDMRLVTGWLEIHVILAKICKGDLILRRDILDFINKPETGSCVHYGPDYPVKVDTVNGIISYEGNTYKFTPVNHITADVASQGQPITGEEPATREEPATGKEHITGRLTDREASIYKPAFEPLNEASPARPEPRIAQIFVDIEGEDDGPKAPICKPAFSSPSNSSHKAACIFLHDVAGDGKSYSSFASFSADYNLPHLQWVFPTAPWNTHIRQPAWFTPTRFSRFSSKLPNPNDPEDEEEILRSVRMVVDIIDELVKQGIPAKRIVVGGFGQGHGIALLTSMVSKYSDELGGVIGLFGYLPLRDRISALREKQRLLEKFVPVPLLITCAMADAYLPRTEFKAQVDKLKVLGYTDATIKIDVYPNMSCLDVAMRPEPLKTTLEFLGKVVPQLKEEERRLKGCLSSQAQEKDEKVAGYGLRKGNRLGRLRRFVGRLRSSTAGNTGIRDGAAIRLEASKGVGTRL